MSPGKRLEKKRRLEKYGKDVNVSTYRRTFIKRRYGYRCACCGTDRHLSVDHVVPVSKGGTRDFDNLQCLCRTCNSIKGQRIVKYQNRVLPVPYHGGLWK